MERPYSKVRGMDTMNSLWLRQSHVMTLYKPWIFELRYGSLTIKIRSEPMHAAPATQTTYARSISTDNMADALMQEADFGLLFSRCSMHVSNFLLRHVTLTPSSRQMMLLRRSMIQLVCCTMYAVSTFDCILSDR